MKLYAIRDRLLNYFQKPFIGETDRVVLAAVAMAVNQEENKVDFTLTPNHFEIWCLAEITEETGDVKPTPRFIATCSELRRGDGQDRADRAAPDARTARHSTAAAGDRPTDPGTTNRPSKGSVESQTGSSGTGGPAARGTSLTS